MRCHLSRVDAKLSGWIIYPSALRKPALSHRMPPRITRRSHHRPEPAGVRSDICVAPLRAHIMGGRHQILDCGCWMATQKGGAENRPQTATVSACTLHSGCTVAALLQGLWGDYCGCAAVLESASLMQDRIQSSAFIVWASSFQLIKQTDEEIRLNLFFCVCVQNSTLAVFLCFLCIVMPPHI